MRRTVDVLAGYAKVQDTYLRTFQKELLAFLRKYRERDQIRQVYDFLRSPLDKVPVSSGWHRLFYEELYMRSLVLPIADVHAGLKVALMPPKVTERDKSPHLQSPAQKVIW